MHLNEWGEEGFISFLSQQFPSHGAALGIGDDCAIIPLHDDNVLLVTTDALVEDLHFLRNEILPSQLGFKTIAVNVSDIAAMGGTPRYAFLSIAMAGVMEREWIEAFVKGLKEGADLWGVKLLGGDTVGSKNELFINLTLLGNAKRDQVKLRSKAQHGDFICVTNFLGDSAAGLNAILSKNTSGEFIDPLLKAHLTPRPSPAEGQWLAAHTEVHAMMDLSDGLNCDLQRLLNASRCGAEVELSSIPISNELKQFAKNRSINALELAVGGGEDYCLLLTVDPAAIKSLQENFQKTFDHPLWCIGRIDKNSNEIIYLEKGEILKKNFFKFNHFSE